MSSRPSAVLSKNKATEFIPCECTQRRLSWFRVPRQGPLRMLWIASGHGLGGDA